MMRTQFTDTHIQLRSGNDIFGGPRMLVRRRFSGKGVIWFKKPLTDGEPLDRISDMDTAEHLEQDFAAGRDRTPAKVMQPNEF